MIMSQLLFNPRIAGTLTINNQALDLADAISAVSSESEFTIESIGGGNRFNFSVQLKNSGGVNLTAVYAVKLLFTSDAAGTTLATTVPSAGTTAIVGQISSEGALSNDYEVLTDQNGLLTLDLNNGPQVGFDMYIGLVLPNQRLLMSNLLQFTGIQ